MNEIKPVFYDEFRCSADKCPQTCCQEWKIAVDDITYGKWKVRCFSDDRNDHLSSFVKKKDGARVIKLNDEKKCPFLSQEGLCGLVLKFGEQILSDTCDRFPRQVHSFSDRTEYSLVACCPEVIDMINSVEKIELVGMFEALEELDALEAREVTENPLLRIRQLLFEIVQNKEYSINKALLMAFYILLDFYQKVKMWDGEGLQNETSDGEFVLPSKAEIEALSDAMDNVLADDETSWLEYFVEQNELFLDMSENYRKEGLYEKLLEPIALLSEQLVSDYEENDMDDLHDLYDTVVNFHKQFVKYEPLMRNFLAMEIYTSLLLPDSDIESTTVMFQWIVMEYSMIRHAMYLYWRNSGCFELEYENVRSYIVMSARMTGYDEADIYEYMENSFESLTWEWGYMLLLLGK